MNMERIRCDLCNRTVKNEFKPKWKHLIRFHPDLFVRRLAPLINNPLVGFELGLDLGAHVRKVLNGD